MKVKTKELIFFVAIPLLVGILSSFLSDGEMAVFRQLNLPPLSPPGWVFPIVWTILYVLMGVASYLIYSASAPSPKISSALNLYSWQLFVNFLWPIFFFRFELYLFSFVWLLFLWGLVFLTMIAFYRISKPAGLLLLPYLLWLTFAAYLNLFVTLLN